jgi:hypothetical protein
LFWQLPWFAVSRITRDDSPVTIDVQVELTEGHELVLLPLMPHWNDATHIFNEDLQVQREE